MLPLQLRKRIRHRRIGRGAVVALGFAVAAFLMSGFKFYVQVGSKVIRQINKGISLYSYGIPKSLICGRLSLENNEIAKRSFEF